ncbi:MAG: hypothetical protein E7K04_02635 [Helicobacter sp.]|nr:hypothetical protein [Helicobacter sp.]
MKKTFSSILALSLAITSLSAEEAKKDDKVKKDDKKAEQAKQIEQEEQTVESRLKLIDEKLAKQDAKLNVIYKQIKDLTPPPRI